MALLNGQVTHEMIDGALFQEEVDALKIQGVPSVYANGKLLHVGRGTLGELLQKLEEMFGSEPVGNAEPISRTYDVLVLGGGPAGASAAIYSARKGLRVAIVAEKVGGQVKETVGIENLISVPQTTGAQLADNLRSHINHYPIDLFEDPTADADGLKKYFAAQAKALLDKGVKIEQVNGNKTLFTVSPADGSYKVNFGEEEFMNYFKEFLRPQLVEMLF